MNMVASIFASVLFCLAISSVYLAPVQGRTLQEEMQAKLQDTQEVLAGIAMEDFSRIEKGVTALLNMCEAVGWTEEKTKGEFERHDVEFHQVANELLRLAKAHNLEGAHYKYIQMTTICMDCHIHVRDIERAQKYGEAHKYEPLWEGKHVHSR